MLRAVSLSLACEASKTCENGQPRGSRDATEPFRGVAKGALLLYPHDSDTDTEILGNTERFHGEFKKLERNLYLDRRPLSSIVESLWKKVALEGRQSLTLFEKIRIL
jgi:hypothetical protein